MDNTINKSLGELTFLMKYMKLFSKMQVLAEISKNKVYWELHISRLHAKCLARGCSLYARKCKAKEKRALNKQAVLYHQSANLCTRQLNALNGSNCVYSDPVSNINLNGDSAQHDH